MTALMTDTDLATAEQRTWAKWQIYLGLFGFGLGIVMGLLQVYVVKA